MANQHDYFDEPLDRRGAFRRLGGWSLGVAATVAGLTVGTSGTASAEIPGDGCCNIYYTRACTGQEWSQGCGTCRSGTSAIGNPDGKWYWSCGTTGNHRFCGECYFRSCHMMYTYSSPTYAVSC